METEVVLSQDNLKNIISFMNPRELKEFLSKNEFMMFLLDDPSVLYNLSRDYFVPYCKDITLDEICKFYNMPKKDLVMEATKMGDIRIIEYLIQPHIKEKYNIDCYFYNIALYKAAELGYKNIVNLLLNSYFISNLARTTEQVMINAACGGHKDIVQMMLDLGVVNCSYSLKMTASNGHKDIVLLLVSKIKDNEQLTSDYVISTYNEAMTSAASNGHVEIVQMMLDLGADNYNETMIYAAGGGHVQIVQMMLDLGANNYNETMIYAAGGGHVEIVQMMLALGANNYNETMINAVGGGHIEIVKIILDLRAYNYNEIMAFAAEEGYIEIIQMMLDLGANIRRNL